MKNVKLLKEALVGKVHEPAGTILTVGDQRAELMVKEGQAVMTRDQPPAPEPVPADPVVAALRPGRRNAAIISGRAG